MVVTLSIFMEAGEGEINLAGLMTGRVMKSLNLALSSFLATIINKRVKRYHCYLCLIVIITSNEYTHSIPSQI